MKIYTLDDIKKRIDLSQIITLQEQGFVLHSKGLTNIPMPGLIKHNHPNAAYHIKYGHIDRDDFWVVKIAGGPSHLPINGMMIAISTATGETKYILQDQGYLTALRTAIAGLIASKYLANKKIKAIGVVGNGLQARMQVEALSHLTDCKTVYVWGRCDTKLNQYKKEMEKKGFDITITKNIPFMTQHCNVLVTTTASETPIIKAEDIHPGTHITAVGADAPNKSELDPALIEKCDVLVVDSKEQCIHHGEISHAYKKGLIAKEKLLELGEVIHNPALGRSHAEQITIADLTGIAVQDIQIVKAIIN